MHSALKERLSSSDEIFDNSENADPHSCNRELVTDGVSDVVATTHDLAALVSVAATAAIPYDGYSIAREAYATPYSGTVNMINNDYFGNECLLLNRVDHNATSLFRTSFVGVGEDVWEGVDNADGDDHLALTGSDCLI